MVEHWNSGMMECWNIGKEKAEGGRGGDWVRG